SAVAAIVLGEPERERFHSYLLSAAGLMSAATRVELGFVLLKKYGADRLPHFWEVVDRYNFTLEPVDSVQVAVALDALARFGRGRRRPPAVLNYGDVF